MTGPGISPASFRPTAQEGKNISAVVVFAKKLQSLAGRRLALVIEGLNAILPEGHERTLLLQNSIMPLSKLKDRRNRAKSETINNLNCCSTGPTQGLINPVLPTGAGFLKVFKNVAVNAQRNTLLGVENTRPFYSRACGFRGSLLERRFGGIP
jgi:hypothetical protein